MKSHLFAGIAVALGALPFFAQSSNDVLMTIDGHNVLVSDLEYLYQKNNNQQGGKQTLDQYLPMFIDYRLKVAEAEKQGLHLTPEFKKEFDNYRADLAAPYLRDTEMEKQILEESMSHYKHDVKVSHIMLPMDPENEHTLDSLREAIVSGKATFEEVAAKHSVDRSSKDRGGLMGYVVPNRFPWNFEKMSYNTPVGQISPVFNSGVGFHIVRVESITPAAGEVSASHILRLTRGKDEAAQKREKQIIDSLYTEIQKGADFAELAKKFSQDPGSGAKGGALGFFPRGAMVLEFDQVSFDLKDGEISKPFATAYGYHIVKREAHRAIADSAAIRKSVMERMAQDERGSAPAEAYINALLKKYNARVSEAGKAKLTAAIEANGGYDSTIIKQLRKADIVVAEYDGGKVTVAEIIDRMPTTRAKGVENAVGLITGQAYAEAKARIMDLAREELALTNQDYRNLLSEFRDGTLLYEVSNKNVWGKAAEDKAGLNKFFKKNIKKYAWDKPRFKSYIIFASSDSVLNLAKAYADSVYTDQQTAFTDSMRKRFGRDVKVERVVAAEGENAITDYLGFKGSKPAADKQSRWSAYAAYRPRVITVPEEPADVRGAAVADYQDYLQEQWIKKLRKSHKVKVNKKVLSELKARYKE